MNFVKDDSYFTEKKKTRVKTQIWICLMAMPLLSQSCRITSCLSLWTSVQLRLRKSCSLGQRWAYSCFPGNSVVKNPPSKAGIIGDMGWNPGSGRSPGVGPFVCSCLGKPVGRGAWQATVPPTVLQVVRHDWAKEHVCTLPVYVFEQVFIWDSESPATSPRGELILAWKILGTGINLQLLKS